MRRPPPPDSHAEDAVAGAWSALTLTEPGASREQHGAASASCVVTSRAGPNLPLWGSRVRVALPSLMVTWSLASRG